jgi:hypothetical protein
MAKYAFPKNATEEIRSQGPRRRFRGKTVGPDGRPRSEAVGAGGQIPKKFGGGRRHTKWARRFWERDGKRDAPPSTWNRGWK